MAFIARHEALPSGQPALKVYTDSAGNPTVGYGHRVLPGEDFSRGITGAQALALLQRDSHRAVGDVNAELKVPVDQNQFDALVDFAYNLGGGNLAKSNLLANINSGKKVTEENFADWDRAGGKQSLDFEAAARTNTAFSPEETTASAEPAGPGTWGRLASGRVRRWF